MKKFLKKIQKKVFHLLKVKNDSNYYFLSKSDVNPKSGLNPDLKSEIRIKSGSESEIRISIRI
jgi:hypothetical protein